MVTGRTLYGSVRASLSDADPLALAMGRPNREQVTTVRQSTATTIQALELTNGDTFAKLLKRGAEQLVATNTDGLKWFTLNRVPDFVFFNHSIHIKRGVNCNNCHGPVQAMQMASKGRPFQMSWCLDCHRHPEKYGD